MAFGIFELLIIGGIVLGMALAVVGLVVVMAAVLNRSPKN